MKIKTIRIKNFRSIKEETIDFDDYTSLVGANGSGKSNVLRAFDVFFRETESPGIGVNFLSEEDFHDKNVDDPIEITVTFHDLSEEAKQDFGHYYRQNALIVSAIAQYNKIDKKAEIRQFGYRTAIKEFSEFFKAEGDGKLVAELKGIYSKIIEKYTELPKPATKPQMMEALRSYEENHPDDCEEIPSQDNFYGVSRGKNLLERHLQWIHVPAVKDASSEQIEARNSALGKLLARTVRAKLKFDDDIKEIRQITEEKYKEILGKNQSALEELSNNLKSRLIEWAHPDTSLRVEWREDPEKCIQIDEPLAQVIAGETGFEGELSRFGHGFQRSFLLALLQELSGSEVEGGPTLILACEEPELYQHPPQARHLYAVLLDLINSNSQVIICTHSPYFVSGENFENVRLIRKKNGSSACCRATIDDISKMIGDAKGDVPMKREGQLAKIHQSLQPALNEMFFSPQIILAEGYEDISYITTYFHLLGLWGTYRKLGCHLIPADGKSEMIRPLSIAKCLKIPVFIVFDADKNQPEKNGRREKHRKNNLVLLNLCGVTNPDAFPSEIFWGDSFVMWPETIEQVIASEIGEDNWNSYRALADSEYGNVGGLRKNTLHIAFSLHLAWQENKKSASLEKLCNSIIKFAEK